MTSSFNWTSLFKSPTSNTSCFGDPTLAKLNQVKLLCETEFCPLKPILFRFLVLQSPNKPKQTLNGPTKHLEEEQLRGNPQNSIMDDPLIIDAHADKAIEELEQTGQVLDKQRMGYVRMMRPWQRVTSPKLHFTSGRNGS